MTGNGRPSTKGTGIRSWSRFVDRRFGPGTMARIVEAMPQDLQPVWPDVLPNAWYPTDFLGEAWTAIARDQLRGDRKEAELFFPELGRVIAEENLSTIYRFILSVMSPHRVVGMTPRLWGTYFDTGSVEVHYEPGKSEGKTAVKGLAVPYLSLVVKGWLELAYDKCGAKSFSVDEEGWLAGRVAPDPMVFVHRWG